MQYRDDGYLPQALLNYLVRLGWSHGDQEISIDEMKEFFTLEAINKSASAFNTEKLQWLNHHYINHMPAEEVAVHLAWHVEQLGIETRNGPELKDIVKLLGERCKTLKEMAESCRYFYEDFSEFDADAAKKHLRPVARQPLEAVRAKLAAITVWTPENVHDAIQGTADERVSAWVKSAAAARRGDRRRPVAGYGRDRACDRPEAFTAAHRHGAGLHCRARSASLIRCLKEKPRGAIPGFFSWQCVRLAR